MPSLDAFRELGIVMVVLRTRSVWIPKVSAAQVVLGIDSLTLGQVTHLNIVKAPLG
jgi:hypothetical protein